MRHKIFQRLFTLVSICTFLLPAGLAFAQEAAAPPAQVGYRYVGTWNGTWTSDDGDIPPFNFSMQLGVDGNAITTESDEFAVSQGVWAATRDGANITLYQYSFSALQTPYQGTFKVRAKVALSNDGQALDGRYYLEFFDANGIVQFTDTGQFACHRVHVQAMR